MLTEPGEALRLVLMLSEGAAIYERFVLDMRRRPHFAETLEEFAEELHRSATYLSRALGFRNAQEIVASADGVATLHISRPPRGLFEAYLQRALSVERQLLRQAEVVMNQSAARVRSIAGRIVARCEAARAKLHFLQPLYNMAPDEPPAARGSRPAEGAGRTSAPSTETEGAEYKVWFGTNRRPIERPDGLGFSTERDETLHLGYCTVHVPRSHRIGQIRRPPWRRIFSWSDDPLRVTLIRTLNPAAFWDGIHAQLSACDEPDRRAVIYVHGYRTTFQQAAKCAAQIGYDLQLGGCMAFFSWPSKGRTLSYFADADALESSEPYLARFLEDFVVRTGSTSVHVIAHSMGNRGLIRALARVMGKLPVKLGQLILAAPDMDKGVFEANASNCCATSTRTTLYTSAVDSAIELATRLYGGAPRIGLLPPVTIFPGVDTVDVSKVDLSYLGHGYVRETREVLADIHALISGGTEPKRRFALKQVQAIDGSFYWRIRN